MYINNFTQILLLLHLTFNLAVIALDKEVLDSRPDHLHEQDGFPNDRKVNHESTSGIEDAVKENGLFLFNHENLLERMTIGKLHSIEHNDKISSTGTLILLAFYEPWCKHSVEMIQKLEQVSNLALEHYKIFVNVTEKNNISPPIIGKMDTSDYEHEELLDFFESFDLVEGLPVLKFILIEHEKDKRTKHRKDNSKRTLIDYVGLSNTTQDIFDAIFHYWFRFVVADDVTNSIKDEINSESKFNDIESTRAIFTLPSLDAVKSFVQVYGNDLFHPVVQDLKYTSEREETYVRELLRDDNDETLSDPYLIFVQCQIKKSHTMTDSQPFLEYQKLAQTYMHRRDVAFFRVVSDSCEWIKTSNTHNDYNWNGSIRVLRIPRKKVSNSDTDHSSKLDGLHRNNWKDGDLFSTNDILNMTHFVIIKTSPQIIWFDRFSTATLAFPIYRKVHSVLFIDMHTPRLRDGTFNYSSPATQQSKYALSQLRNAAYNHSQKRSLEDVVFLVVPSTETEIMTTFGIDIWSQMDSDCTTSSLKECYISDISLLPMVMITSRRESDSYMLRYNLRSELLLQNMSTTVTDKTGAIDHFLSSYFDGKLTHEHKTEPISQQRKLKSGVEIVTGATFQSLIMSGRKHTLLQLYAPHCGHCKRFNIIWNELAKLIKQFNWDSVVNVMKVDVSQNEILHDKIDVRYIPSVFLFPKDQKDEPIEMKIVGDEESNASNVGGVSDVSLILKWMVETGIFDNELLLQLIEGDLSNDAAL
mmetsp:Transcript_12534/g.14137  ORF Transcript_12534/g.14137 Transcript_12534/m.14137 type:complete len:755 (-) Transcript_12534:3953-6217(-)